MHLRDMGDCTHIWELQCTLAVYNGGLSVRPWNSSLFLDPVLGFQTLTENTCPMHNGTPNPKSSAFDFAFAAALGGMGDHFHKTKLAQAVANSKV